MRVSLLVAAAWLFGSMLVVGQQRNVADHDSRWTSPPDQAAKTNPLPNHAEVVDGGKKLFQQRCATCHGRDASGTAKAPNLTGGTVQHQSDGALFWKITSGNTRSGMPTFSFLPPLQRWQLVLYLRSESSAQKNARR